MAAKRKAPRVVLAALVLVIGLSVFLGTRWLRHARVERARQRLEAVAVPVYPGATDVKRHVMTKPMVVLLVSYQVPVSYPSKAVLDLYDRRLVPQGWVETTALPSATREWGEVYSHGGATGGLERMSPGKPLYALIAAWRNPQQDLTLQLLLRGQPAEHLQYAVVNVWPAARVEAEP